MTGNSAVNALKDGHHSEGGRPMINHRLISASVAALLMSALTGASEEVIASKTIHLRFTPAAFRRVEHKNYDYVELPECERSVGPAGVPDLPVRQIRLLLPAGATATAVRAIPLNERSLPGRFRVYPIQPPVRPGDPPPPFVEGQKEIYESPGPYPAQPVELLGTQEMRGYSIALIAVYPLRFVGKSGELRMISECDIEVEYALDTEAAPTLHPNQWEHFQETVRRLAHNPDDEPKCRP